MEQGSSETAVSTASDAQAYWSVEARSAPKDRTGPVRFCALEEPRLSLPAARTSDAPRVESGTFSFTALGGQEVVFKQVDGKWVGEVSPVLPAGFSCPAKELAVVCQGHGDVKAALSELGNKPNRFTRRRVHVLDGKQHGVGFTGGGVVYIGEMGLRGGDKYKWYVKVASDSDPDNSSPQTRVRCGTYDIRGAAVTCFPCDGCWHARVDHDGGYDVIPFTVSEPGVRLSANDMRHCDAVLWYKRRYWGTFHRFDKLKIPPDELRYAWRKRRERREHREQRYYERRRRIEQEQARERARQGEIRQRIEKQERWIEGQQEKIDAVREEIRRGRERVVNADKRMAEAEEELDQPDVDIDLLEKCVEEAEQELDMARGHLASDKMFIAELEEAAEEDRSELQEIDRIQSEFRKLRAEEEGLEMLIAQTAHCLKELEEKIRTVKKKKMWRNVFKGVAIGLIVVGGVALGAAYIGSITAHTAAGVGAKAGATSSVVIPTASTAAEIGTVLMVAHLFLQMKELFTLIRKKPPLETPFPGGKGSSNEVTFNDLISLQSKLSNDLSKLREQLQKVRGKNREVEKGRNQKQKKLSQRTEKRRVESSALETQRQVRQEACNKSIQDKIFRVYESTAQNQAGVDDEARAVTEEDAAEAREVEDMVNVFFDPAGPDVSGLLLIPPKKLEGVFNAVLDYVAPGSKLIQIMLGTAEAPGSWEEWLEVTLDTVIDFLPGGKALKLPGGQWIRARFKNQLAAFAAKKAAKIPFKLTKRMNKVATKLFINKDSKLGRQILINLDTPVQKFISQHKKGSIKTVFPDEFLNKTVEEALLSGNSTVIKLLKNSKYVK